MLRQNLEADFVAEVRGTEQPADDSTHVPDSDAGGASSAPAHGHEQTDIVSVPVLGSKGDGAGNNEGSSSGGSGGTGTDWSSPEFDRSETSEEAPPAGEQIRRTDEDRWAASFANVTGAHGGGTPDTGAQHQQWSDQSQVDRPAWAQRAPAPPTEPAWSNVGSGSGWGQPRAAGPAPAPAWTTEVPSGFNWRPDENDGPVDRSRQGRTPNEREIPSNPPSPIGYPRPEPSANAQTGDESWSGQSAGGLAAAGPQRGDQHAPSPQSRWSTDGAAHPNPPRPAQQWQPQPGSQQAWRPGSQQVAQHGSAVQHSSAADLTASSLVKAPTAVPRVGWRAMVHAVTGGAVNPGLSQAEQHRRDLIERATAPVRGCHRIAVVSLKGGIGKTTTTAGIGLTLAEHRGDRVVALDANPDAGTLAERLTGQIDVTVRDLLDNLDSIRSFTDVSAFTSLAARLQVLASEQDPEMSEAFSEEEYCTVADVLARYFNIVLTDSGTGLLHSAMSGTLAMADSLVVVGSPSVDGASRASKTLDWLIAHGHGELVSRAVAVISTVRPASKELDMVRLREHFSSRVRGVVEIPYDRHLVTGGIIDIAQLDPPTEQSFLELAATVADGFRLPPLIRPATTD